MNQTVRAYSVHLFTATGAVFAMLALLEAAKGDWAMMFLWLVVAFIVDGIDGPLARRYQVKKNAPIIDGGLLDLIIDYLTYVFIPAFALFQSGLLPGWTGWIAIIVITFTSVLYFADSRMKTADNSFQGFPACWNMAAVVIFATQPGFWLILLIVGLLAVSMFTQLKFIHPVRTERWRSLSLPVALVWTALAAWAAWADFAQPAAVTWGLIVTTLYLALVGIVQQMFPERR
ncbi:CDP-alcohol phosphatidyltransferase family protein [Rhodobacteraceae bacterium 2376]|uniref:Phosphatidylcholine synthase n=1 Tax=Rhabdonatronobacter sediminivivens TaxID=2743469 RepID=A0A7Z0HXW2_9RHOB|nr:CDP-alcohol phosphatidyltransferase family protein [Rhabdonatronobacter sediminivivens]NYS24252.1 CDP-alcohol phosphatidyltransferase family protein [Rhabdonatronobacter sediminivivens]